MSSLSATTALLEETFARIERQRMQGMALLNRALHVEAVGFEPQGDAWLGVLITPWFINLVMLPRNAAQWASLPISGTTVERLPIGEFEFLVGRDEMLGAFKSCTLFSPALEFADQQAARSAACAALKVLRTARKPLAATRTPDISRRAFLSGSFGGEPR